MIDKIFRGYGEEFFGKECMDQITNAQVEEARCWVFTEVGNLTAAYGKQPSGTVKKLFCNYIFSKFI